MVTSVHQLSVIPPGLENHEGLIRLLNLGLHIRSRNIGLSTPMKAPQSSEEENTGGPSFLSSPERVRFLAGAH